MWSTGILNTGNLWNSADPARLIISTLGWYSIAFRTPANWPVLAAFISMTLPVQLSTNNGTPVTIGSMTSTAAVALRASTMCCLPAASYFK